MLSGSGKASIVIMFILSQFFSFGMSSLLGQVRSLGLITHFMIMQLNYAAAVSLFFGALLEFVTFDVVPTDDIYGAVFDFDSEPFSE